MSAIGSFASLLRCPRHVRPIADTRADERKGATRTVQPLLRHTGFAQRRSESFALVCIEADYG